MFDAACTHPNAQKTYSILSFQKLPDTDIERYRQHLEFVQQFWVWRKRLTALCAAAT